MRTLRPASPRRDARPALAVASVATVAWAAWRAIVTPSPLLGTLLVVAAVVLAAASVPAAATAAALSPRLGRRLRGLDRPLAVALGVALVGWVGAALLAPTAAGVADVAGALLALVEFAVVLPLAVGSLVADRRGVPVRVVLLAWPASLVVGLGLFLAPGADGVDFGRYNAMFLDEPWRSAVFVAIGAVVVLGPPAVAVVVAARRGRPPPEVA